MALEIERKFLVKYIPDIEPIDISPYILQGYLKTGSDYEVRISNRLHLTQKKWFRTCSRRKYLSYFTGSLQYFSAINSWQTSGKKASVLWVKKWINRGVRYLLGSERWFNDC